MKTDINQLISTLIDQLHIDQIYQWTYRRDGKKHEMLHIHLIPESGMRFGEAKEICTRIVDQYQGIYFTLYYRREIQHLIDQGLSRFILICHPENKVYQNEAMGETDIESPTRSITEVVKRSEVYIATEKQKVQSFLDGYHFYLDNKNLAHASFMLHQALELTLRTALMLLVGDEKKSHCLVNNISHLKTYDSALGRLNIKDKDRHALVKLNNSYSAFRYNQGFQIAREELETVYHIACRAKTWLDGYQEEYIAEIKQWFNPVFIAEQRIARLKDKYFFEISADEHSDQQFILKALEIYCTIKSVRCFAYKSREEILSDLIHVVQRQETKHHYYLMITLEENTLSVLELQNYINQIVPKHLMVTLIVEEEKSYLDKVCKGDVFSCHIVRIGELWYGEGFTSDLMDQIHPQVANASYRKIQWGKKHNNAVHLCLPYIDDPGFGSEEVICFSLASAMEQICLGLLRVFWQFQPSSTNLRYLMQLCKLICPEAVSVFLLDHPKAYTTFKLLIDAQQQFRYAPNYRAQGQHLSVLLERTQKFIQTANEHVLAYFADLEVSSDEGLQEKLSETEHYA